MSAPIQLLIDESGRLRNWLVAMRPHWVELCCGSAAVTLRLLGGPRALPPVTYQGGKRKFAGAILAALGLRAGQGAKSVLLVDAGPWGDVWSHISVGYDLAPFMAKWEHGEGLNPDEYQARIWPILRDTYRGEFGPTDPVEMSAAWLWLLQRSFGGKGPGAGFASRQITHGPKSNQGEWRHTLDAPVPRLGALEAMPWPTTRALRADICEIRPFGGAIVYIDPPYQGCTGYPATLEREDLLEVARAWRDAGSVVAVSEAEPLELEEWHHVDITSARTGTPRNRSKQQREWLTMSHPPASIPSTQLSLIGAS